jgi:hypothetical protein
MGKQIEISDETYRVVEATLAARGDAANVDEYVERAVNRHLFFETVREIREKNKNIDPDQLQQEIDEAVEGVRAERRKELEAELGADRS